MSTFKMRWPDLGLEVTCESIAENKEAFDLFTANMPVRAIQGHEMVGGFLLRDHSVLLKKKPFDLDGALLCAETMEKAPVGRISLLFPAGGCTELLVKYGDSVDTRSYIPIAIVRETDLGTLKSVGALQWKSASRTKEVITVSFEI